LVKAIANIISQVFQGNLFHIGLSFILFSMNFRGLIKFLLFKSIHTKKKISVQYQATIGPRPRHGARPRPKSAHVVEAMARGQAHARTVTVCGSPTTARPPASSRATRRVPGGGSSIGAVCGRHWARCLVVGLTL
jgi:hypothetical protein